MDADGKHVGKVKRGIRAERRESCVTQRWRCVLVSRRRGLPAAQSRVLSLTAHQETAPR